MLKRDKSGIIKNKRIRNILKIIYLEAVKINKYKFIKINRCELYIYVNTRV